MILGRVESPRDGGFGHGVGVEERSVAKRVCGNKAAVRWVDGEAIPFEGYDSYQAWLVHFGEYDRCVGLDAPGLTRVWPMSTGTILPSAVCDGIDRWMGTHSRSSMARGTAV